MTNIGTSARPLNVAVIGAGPSGFYAIDALLKQEQVDVRIDLFDRLPVPYGLVRYGVAPDHQKIKNVTRQYEKMAADPRVRFAGNVALGRDVTLDELRAHYDQIVIATGCLSDRKLGLEHEDAAGSYSATEFVGWYNGHPDFQDRKFDLSHERAVVVGVGNVAMDVTRILVKDRDELATTDITAAALDALRAAGVREVVVLGRRGAAQAAFSPKEIREIGELEGVRLVVEARDLEGIDLEALDRDKRKNVEYLQEKLADPGEGDLTVRLRFLSSPVRLSVDGDGHLNAVTIERNRLVDRDGYLAAEGTGETETIEAGLLLRSIGYRGEPLPGVPFDERAGIVANRDGRVVDGDAPVPGLYVVGWIKRGPSGLIGSNKPDSAATVAAMLEDVDSGVISGATETGDLLGALQRRGVRVVDWDDYTKIDAAEVARGQASGKVREKFVSVADMLAVLD
ncbi:MAG: NADP oxidoreductase [Candidatus Dadabacteria bacterium]|nr:MAG: NADP oxidoreductase [Candidatus Dadabacteria bacterium]